MKSYTELIESTPIIRHVETTVTTGDLDYNGTALEVEDASGNELFHVVVDEKGEQQFLIYPMQERVRIPLQVLEEVLLFAKKKVQVAENLD
ncbi:MAG: hypothetical protein CME32_03630 [Gimesia sp.]|jgi:hypothetical protein|nr:hypothetical protein [Gimesia sp.]